MVCRDHNYFGRTYKRNLTTASRKGVPDRRRLKREKKTV